MFYLWGEGFGGVELPAGEGGEGAAAEEDAVIGDEGHLVFGSLADEADEGVVTEVVGCIGIEHAEDALAALIGDEGESGAGGGDGGWSAKLFGESGCVWMAGWNVPAFSIWIPGGSFPGGGSARLHVLAAYCGGVPVETGKVEASVGHGSVHNNPRDPPRHAVSLGAPGVDCCCGDILS